MQRFDMLGLLRSRTQLVGSPGSIQATCGGTRAQR